MYSPIRVSGAALVSREDELNEIKSCWRATEAGHALLALVTGEPGIGKTRLVDELENFTSRSIEPRSCSMRWCPVGTSLSLWPSTRGVCGARLNEILNGYLDAGVDRLRPVCSLTNRAERPNTPRQARHFRASAGQQELAEPSLSDPR
jgi:predicted ATPase